jgi:hypothetical protein
MVLVEVDKDLGVSVRPEDMAGGDEIAAQFDVVVDFPVKDDAYRLILVPNGLPAALEIDDAEATHPEPEAGSDVRAGAVRTAMSDQVEHSLKTDL